MPPPSRGPRPSTYELIETIVGFQLRGAVLAELADGILPSLLDGFGASAGGLLLYRSEDSSLRLAASEGLTPAGRAQLEQGTGGWEIPLHGLLNRKAYIIERPGEHPFVPELVVPELAARMPNLASIPLYRGQLPVGVFLVMADRRPLTETDVMSHVLAFDVLALALDAGLRARGEEPRPLAAATDVPPLTCEEWRDPREVVRQLEATLRDETEAREALLAKLVELEQRHAETVRVLAQHDAESAQTLEVARTAAAEEVAERERAYKEQLARQRAATTNRVSEERGRYEATVKELQAALVDRESTFESSLRKLQNALGERDTLLTDRDREIAALVEDRDRITRAAVEAGESIERLNHELERIRGELEHADATHAGEREHVQLLYEGKLAEVDVAHRQALAEAETAATAAAARADAVETERATLERQLGAARAEAARLGEQREGMIAALGDIDTEPALAIRGLRERMVALEDALARAGAEQGSLERRLALEVQASEERVAAHHREIQELHAAHQEALEELTTSHQREVEETRAAHRREIEQVDAGHRALVAQMQADFEHRLEQGRFEATRALEEVRGDSEHRLEQLAAAHAEALDRGGTAAARVEALDHELATMRAEVARLHEERALVMAAVDDPDAEPAAVIKALREQVVALEGEARAANTAQAVVEARAAELAQAAGARLAEARAAAEATERELRATIEERNGKLAQRERALAELGQEQERAGQAVHETREIMQRQSAEIERVLSELGTAQSMHAETLARVAAATGRAEALEGEVMAVRTELGRLRDEREQVLAAVDDPGAAPAEVIRALRQQVGDLEQTLGTLAADRGALERRLAAEGVAHAEQLAAQRRELEARDAGWRLELDGARATIERLEAVAAQRATLDERLAAAERERAAAEAERAVQVARASTLERDLGRSETMLASTREHLTAAIRGGSGASDQTGARAGDATASNGRLAVPAAGSAPAGAGLGSRPLPTPTPPRVQVLEPPPAPVVEARSHRVLEGNAALREQIMFALASELPKAERAAFVVNLVAAIPSRLVELDAAMNDGAVVVAYASDGSARSRILGPVQCFVDFPTPEDVLAAVERAPGARRVITLCEDVDALIPTKTLLTEAGHSVSMAYDPKQALDLLAMLMPEVVLVDLRTAPESAVEFLEALPLETGCVRLLLIHDDPSGAVLKRVLGRLLQPTPLDPKVLIAACKNAIHGGPLPTPKKSASARTPRTPERPSPTTRKLTGRRLVGKRR